MFDLSCHCGAVALEVDADPPTQAISCNCSHCRRKGLLLTFLPRDQVRITRGEDHLVSYRFNTRRIEHRLCPSCGCQPFAEGAMPDGSPIRALNLRCARAIDLDALEIQKIDGASL